MRLLPTDNHHGAECSCLQRSAPITASVFRVGEACCLDTGTPRV